MDERALAWLHLLPHGATLCPTRAPEALLALLGGRAEPRGDVWLAWGARPGDLPAPGRCRAAALINPRGIGARALAARGLPHVRAFAAVPSLADARWFIPLGPGPAARAAWQLYAPYHAGARLSRSLAALLSRAGAAALLGDRVVVAQAEPGPLERALASLLGEARLSLAIASGQPEPWRAPTLQVATAAGQVLAYAKLADSPAAVKVLRREVALREYVRDRGLRRVIAPAVRSSGPFGAGHLMVSEPAPGDLRPSRPSLGPEHHAALAELAGQRGATDAGELIGRLRRRIARLDGQIDGAWGRRLAAALAHLEAAPELRGLPSALSHGDFAPWNIRVGQRGAPLTLLDWAGGQAEQLPLWDACHFHTMVAALVRRQGPAAPGDGPPPELAGLGARIYGLGEAQVRALYLAYLADASVSWLEEHPPHWRAADDAAQKARGSRLDRLVVGA